MLSDNRSRQLAVLVPVGRKSMGPCLACMESWANRRDALACVDTRRLGIPSGQTRGLRVHGRVGQPNKRLRATDALLTFNETVHCCFLAINGTALRLRVETASASLVVCPELSR